MAPASSYEPLRRLHPEFRSWLVQRMFQERFQKVEDQVNRFEIVCGFLSHKDQRLLDFQAIAEDSGYSDNLLRDTMRRIGERLGLVEKVLSHEGFWYSLKVDPFSPPHEVEQEPKSEQVGESSMERLYRECCDEANEGVREVILQLDTMRKKVEPAVGALVMDACVNLGKISILLTQISATGVSGDREEYIKGLREKIQGILKG